jgi:hypothetical protein
MNEFLRLQHERAIEGKPLGLSSLRLPLMNPTRRRLFSSFLGLPLFGQKKGKVDLRVTFPLMSHQAVSEIMGIFFEAGDKAQEKRIEAVIGEARDITLVVTTRPGPDGTNTVRVEILSVKEV